MKTKTLGLCLLIFWVFLSSCVERDKQLSSPEFDEAIEYLSTIQSEKHISIFKKSLDSAFNQVKQKRPLDWYHYYEYSAMHTMLKGDIDVALQYSDSMLNVLTDVPGVESEYLHALIQKGVLYQRINLYSAALNEFYSAGTYAEQFLDECGSAKVYDNIGILLFEQKSYQDALYYFDKARQGAWGCDTSEYHNFFLQLQSVYNSIGLCHEREGRLDSARKYYETGLNFIYRFEKLYPKNTDFIQAVKAVLYGNLGNTELLSGNLDRADSLFTASVAITLEKGHFIHDAIYTRIKQGQLAFARKQFKTVNTLIDSIKKDLNNYPNQEAWKRLHSLEVKYFIAIGDTSKAFLARENQAKADYELANLKKELPSLNVTNSLSYFKQKEELKDLQETNRRNFFLTISSIVLLLLLGIITFLIRKNLLNSKAHAWNLTLKNDELKANNDQLIKTMEDLESSQAENTRIMKIIAHDLRSPVASILGMTRVILLGDIQNKELRDEIKMIKKVSHDSLKFMDDLLTMQGASQTEEKKLTDLLELIDYCVNYMQIRADEKKQHISIIGPHVFVPVYRERVWRVLNNLISNAIKFSPMGCEIVIQLNETPTHVKVTVQDQGIGIPSVLEKKIFDVNAESGRTGTAGERSFGLGLAISMQIMEAHGGRIWFESLENKGSKFFLEFPKL